MRYSVDETWTQYIFREANSEYRIMNSRHNMRQTVADGGTYDNVLYWETDPTIESSVEVTRNFVGSMPAGYPAPVPVNGRGLISLHDNADLDLLVGHEAEVYADIYVSSSTSFDPDYQRVFTFDVGGILVGASTLLAAKWQGVGSHGYRITMAFAGVMASAVNGLWTVNVAWSFKHDKAIDDKWDSITFFIDITTSGYVGQAVMRVIDP